jgi:biotin operon repressor
MSKPDPDCRPSPEQLRAILDATLDFEHVIQDAGLIEGQKLCDRLEKDVWWTSMENWVKAMNFDGLPFEEYTGSTMDARGWPSHQMSASYFSLHEIFTEIIHLWQLKNLFGADPKKLTVHWGKNYKRAASIFVGDIVIAKPARWPPALPIEKFRRLHSARERLARSVERTLAELRAEQDRIDLAAMVASKIGPLRLKFDPSELQSNILNLLDGKRMKLAQLATLLGKKEAVICRAIDPLKRAGIVVNRKRGYYRLDSPPPDLAQT